MIPKEEDLVSLYVEEDKLWMLAQSPILNPLDAKANLYILYEGSLLNINSLMTRKELLMSERYEFKYIQNQLVLKYKSIFSFEERIYLVGGLNITNNNNNLAYREDYILEKIKDKLRIRVRRVESKEGSVELISPAVVKHKDIFLMYSLCVEEKPFIRA